MQSKQHCLANALYKPRETLVEGFSFFKLNLVSHNYMFLLQMYN